jgi:hypothetical protein
VAAGPLAVGRVGGGGGLSGRDGPERAGGRARAYVNPRAAHVRTSPTGPACVTRRCLATVEHSGETVPRGCIRNYPTTTGDLDTPVGEVLAVSEQLAGVE